MLLVSSDDNEDMEDYSSDLFQCHFAECQCLGKKSQVQEN